MARQIVLTTCVTLSQFLPIRPLWSPAAMLFLLAFSLFISPATHGLPISLSTSSSSFPIPSLSAGASKSPSLPPSLLFAQSALNGAPFRRLASPITIQVDLTHTDSFESDDMDASKHSDPPLHHDEYTELQELRLLQEQQEAFARLQAEQDRLEREEQDRDQLQDNEEEEREDEDPETVRRRQEEALGLWITNADIDTFSQGTPYISVDDSFPDHGPRNEHKKSKNDYFDLFAEGMEEDSEYLEQGNEIAEDDRSPLSTRSSIRSTPMRLSKEFPTEEEMLQWPMVNVAEFEDRQDEVQDEYDEQS